MSPWWYVVFGLYGIVAACVAGACAPSNGYGRTTAERFWLLTAAFWPLVVAGAFVAQAAAFVAFVAEHVRPYVRPYFFRASAWLRRVTSPWKAGEDRKAGAYRDGACPRCGRSGDGDA